MTLPTRNDVGSLNLNVMQLNAWLIPVRPSFPGCLDFNALPRAERMALWLVEQASEKRLDIALFQEVWTPWRSFVACTIHSMFCCRLFGRHLIEKALADSLPYHTAVHGSRPCDFTKRFFDSGLMISSRFPIVDEEFAIFPSGSSHDALSSKGILVAALRRPADGAIIIAASSHLDAGPNDAFKLDQLRVAITTIQSFSDRIALKYPAAEIVATIFGSDMNIDGIEFWDSTNSYAIAKNELEAIGFQDTWLLTARAVPSIEERARKCYTPDSHPELGITSDQHDCVKRLDYIWASPGKVGLHQGQSLSAAAPAGHVAKGEDSVAFAPVLPALVESPPIQIEMGTMEPPRSKHALRRFDVAAVTELNDGVLWRSSASMRVDLDKAVRAGDKRLARQLSSRIDLHDREMRLSDHAALFAKIHMFPHPAHSPSPSPIGSKQRTGFPTN